MAKSSTRKRSKPKKPIDPAQLAEVERNVANAVKYIDDWKKRELEHLALNSKSDIPICIPINKNAFVVGRYGVKRTGHLWVAIDSLDSAEYNFSRRTTAVLFTLCKQTGYGKIANDLLLHDTNVIKITQELENYKFSKDRAQRKKDYWRVDHFYIMSSDAEFRLSDAKNQLEKSIHLAKYFKVWTD